jgi:hypothetical protein
MQTKGYPKIIHLVWKNYQITDEMYNYPGRNVNIIKMMREAYPNKFKEKNTNINSKGISIS